MPTLRWEPLRDLARAIFASRGVPEDQAHMVADALVRANLAGHDSHGVIRIPEYVEWMGRGDVQPVAEIRVLKNHGPLLAIEGNHGFGQVIGRAAMNLALSAAREHGLAVMHLSHSAHLGRIGDYPAMAVEAGFLSVHFVNTHGGGRIVAPYGGSDRRMSANPVAAGIPVPGRTPVIIDFSTCAIAGGKVHVAHNMGRQVPAGCLIDRHGRPTTDPAEFMSGFGALLGFAGHRGYAIGFLCDVLAGALGPASCSHPALTRVANAMLTIILSPGAFRPEQEFHAEVARYIDYLKGSPLREGFSEILYPGEPEARTERARMASGIELDDNTWAAIVNVAARCRVPVDLAACA
jgi:uncharacterized oxidoreductase